MTSGDIMSHSTTSDSTAAQGKCEITKIQVKRERWRTVCALCASQRWIPLLTLVFGWIAIVSWFFSGQEFLDGAAEADAEWLHIWQAHRRGIFLISLPGARDRHRARARHQNVWERTHPQGAKAGMKFEQIVTVANDDDRQCDWCYLKSKIIFPCK